jgi:signal transduction histidine kinase
VIERQIAQMTRLLEDLLDVSRVTRNKIELRRERVEVQRVIAEAVETTRPLIDAQRHRLTLELPAEPIVIYTDNTRLTQVVGNLLNNAAKYTDAGGQIEIAARREGDEVAIRVRDSGIGIESNQVPQVFDMFAQLAPALERSRGGLTACRRQGAAQEELSREFSAGASCARATVCVHRQVAGRTKRAARPWRLPGVDAGPPVACAPRG